MTAVELVPLLEGVRTRGKGKWAAKCPAHADKSPSLTLTEGDKGLLLKCWAGCVLEEIVGALRLSVKDLFFDALSTDPQQRREAMRQRAHAQATQHAAQEAQGQRLDALRMADHLIQSARGLSIVGWSDDKLNAELDRLAAAYALLDSEGRS